MLIAKPGSDAYNVSMFLAVAFLVAQAYGCGNYGSAAYNQCSSSNTSQTTPAEVVPTTTNTPITTNATQTTPSPSPSPQPHTTQPTVNSATSAVAKVDYGSLLLFSVIGAVFLALLWWFVLFLWRRRHPKLSQF